MNRSGQLSLALESEPFELRAVSLSIVPHREVAIVTPHKSLTFPRLVEVYRADRSGLTTWSTWSRVWVMRFATAGIPDASEIGLMRALFPAGEVVDNGHWTTPDAKPLYKLDKERQAAGDPKCYRRIEQSPPPVYPSYRAYRRERDL